MRIQSWIAEERVPKDPNGATQKKRGSDSGV